MHIFPGANRKFDPASPVAILKLLSSFLAVHTLIRQKNIVYVPNQFLLIYGDGAGFLDRDLLARSMLQPGRNIKDAPFSYAEPACSYDEMFGSSSMSGALNPGRIFCSAFMSSQR